MAPLLEDIARKDRFPLDREGWPGRELYWCWRNPFLTLLILVGVVAQVAQIVAHVVGLV